MSTEATPYRVPPIAEAVVELRFRGGKRWDQALQKSLVDALREEYRGTPSTAGQLHLAARLEGATVLTHGQFAHDVAFFPTEDAKASVGLAIGRISVHVLEPYPGWAVFRPRIERALDLYWHLVTPEAVEFVSVRYLDRWKLPKDVSSFHELLPLLPQRPASAPFMLQAFHVVTQAYDPQLDYHSVLTIASAPPENEQPVVLYDLSVMRSCAERPVALDEALAHVDFLHERQKLIFEDSITDKTRELFR